MSLPPTALPSKILHVETGRHLYGGAQQVVHLISGLRTRGVPSVLVCAAGSDIARSLAGVAKIYEVPIRGELDWGLTRHVLRVARQERPAIVHLHSRRGADLFGGLAARWGHLPVVLSRRVDTAESRWTSPLKYQLFDRVIAISHCIERVLLESGVPPAKVSCVHSGIDAAAFAMPADRAWLCGEFGFPPGSLVVGMIAQLIPRKGHTLLLQAISSLAAAYPQLRAILFGQGPLEASLRDEITARGLKERVLLGGFRRDLSRIVPSLDLVVHPALAEGLGVALIQSAAAGVPIIGTHAGGVPEIVRDQDNGLLVPPGDASALAAAMDRLLGDETLRKQMGQRGRELVAREFSLEQMVAGNLVVYQDLLAAPAALRRRAS